MLADRRRLTESGAMIVCAYLVMHRQARWPRRRCRHMLIRPGQVPGQGIAVRVRLLGNENEHSGKSLHRRTLRTDSAAPVTRAFPFRVSLASLAAYYRRTSCHFSNSSCCSVCCCTSLASATALYRHRGGRSSRKSVTLFRRRCHLPICRTPTKHDGATNSPQKK